MSLDDLLRPKPKKVTADEALAHVTQGADLTEEDEQALRAEGLGELADDVRKRDEERRAAGNFVPPWMN